MSNWYQLVPRVADAREPGEVDRRDARVVVADVAVEAGDADVGAGRRHPFDHQVVERVQVEAVVADPEVVEERRRQRLLPGHQGVLVLAWLEQAGGGDDVAEAVERVHPVVADVEARRVADVLVDPQQQLVDVALGQRRCLIVVAGAVRRPRQVRQRVVLQQPDRFVRELRERDLVARVRLLGDGVDDLRADLAEVAAPHPLGRHRRNRAGRPLGAQPFVGAHEERLVAAVVQPGNHHGAVEREAELVAPLGRLGQIRIVEVAAALERVVLEVLEERAVEVVGAGLGDDVDVHAEVRAVLGRRAAGLHLDLGDRIGHRPHAGHRQQVGAGVDAIHRQAVLNLPLAGAAEGQADVGGRCHAARRAWSPPAATRCGRSTAGRPRRAPRRSATPRPDRSGAWCSRPPR